MSHQETGSSPPEQNAEKPTHTEIQDISIDPKVLEFINNLEYPKILVGKFDPSANFHPSVRQSTKLNQREKKLFKYINTVLQYPPCVAAHTETLKPRTQISYASEISRYVLYVAAHTELDESTFKVDGVLMRQCAKNTVETLNLKPDNIRKFKHSLKALHECLGMHQTAHIQDPDQRALVMHRDWLKIPNIDVVHALYKEKVSQQDVPLRPGKYAKKDSSQGGQMKYTASDFRKMMINMLEKTSSAKKKDIYDGINAMLEFLLGHHLLLTGPNKINLKFSHLVYTEEETPNGTIPILGFHTSPGEITAGGTNASPTPSTSPTRLPKYPAVCRNKDAETCLVSALAFSLWYRFDFADHHGQLTGENTLNFMENKWKDVKVLFSSRSGSALHKPVSPTYSHTLATMCFDSIGFKSSKKMNAGRNTNAENYALQVTELGDSAARRRTSQGSSYDADFIHFSAGFQPDEPYHISRDVAVPEELKHKVFPWLDKAREQIASGINGDQENEETARFLHMLDKLRPVILQDLALLVDKAPNSIYAQHPITSEPLFVKFKEEVLNTTPKDVCLGDFQDVTDEADQSAALSDGEVDDQANKEYSRDSLMEGPMGDIPHHATP
ncbi:hypothetical protein JCM33374_g5206 [Metschnikowia sp. JCM 33374]|nr:hypothetical protein JCM33374_g5206 [Metschnikowia sp. JCM 33374]